MAIPTCIDLAVPIALPSHGEAVAYTCTNCQTIRRVPAPPVFDLDALPPDVAGTSTELAPNTASTSTGADAEAGTQSTNNIKSNRVQGTSMSTRHRKKRLRKNAVPRLPPLFERKGHVVFRGNEKLPAED